MKQSNDIHSLLASWGKGQRQLSAHNEEIKKKVLTSTPEPSRTGPLPAYQLPWLSFAFGGLAVLMLLVGGGTERLNTSTVAVPSSGVATGLTAPVAEMGEDADFGAREMATANQSTASDYAQKKGMTLPEYYPRPWPSEEVPITDTREFTRTDYSATLRTRSVQGLTRRSETTVRGFGGRVDSSSNSEKWGFVSFAVPASNFEAFRNEIESFVGPRFITVETRTENLLPQKQSIEEQQRQIETNIVDLRAQRKNLVASHTSAVSALQLNLSNGAHELTQLRAELTSDPVRKAYITARIQELVTEQSTLQARLTSENASYARRLSSLDNMIQGADSSLAWVATQDQTLLDTVATVRGTISLSWISIWEVVKLYVSPSWMALIFAVAAIGTAIRSRRHSRAALL